MINEEIFAALRSLQFTPKWINDTVIFNNDSTIDIGGDFYRKRKNIKMLPFKINQFDDNFVLSQTPLETLLNCPNVVHGNYYIADSKLKSLEYFPKAIGGQINIALHKKINPYNARYIFYSNILGEIQINDEEIYAIVNKYYGKSEYLHLAMEELMNLGEARGFTYG